MVNISEALDKAGYGEGLKWRKESTIQETLETQQPSVLTPLPLPPVLTPLPLPPVVERSKTDEHQCGKWDERLFKAVNEDTCLSEVFKSLRSRILHPWDKDTIPQSIMVTSSIPKEGKSFITANLGISLAQAVDKHVLLVDCDLRKPTLSTTFGLEYKVGLVDYLRDNVDLSELIMKTSLRKLSILASGKPPVNPAELLGSSRMLSLVKELSQRYADRIIIFDTPPMLFAAESAVLASHVDGVIIVVRHGKSGKTQIKKLIETIGTDQILGIVYNANNINYMEKNILKGYDYYNQSYYHNKEN